MKRTNKIASQAMKIAHSIKSKFSTFSAALKAAWAQVKKPAFDLVALLLSLGKEWQSGEKHRVYIKNEKAFLKALGFSIIGTNAAGFIKDLRDLDGDKMGRTDVDRILSAISGMYYDMQKQTFFYSISSSGSASFWLDKGLSSLLAK